MTQPKLIHSISSLSIPYFSNIVRFQVKFDFEEAEFFKVSRQLDSFNQICPFARMWVGYCKKGTSDKYYVLGLSYPWTSNQGKVYAWWGRRYALGGFKNFDGGLDAMTDFAEEKTREYETMLGGIEASGIGMSLNLVRWPDGKIVGENTRFHPFIEKGKSIKFGDYWMVSPKITPRAKLSSGFNIKGWAVCYRVVGIEDDYFILRYAKPVEEYHAKIGVKLEQKMMDEVMRQHKIEFDSLG